MVSIRQVKTAGRGSRAHGQRPIKTAALRLVRGGGAKSRTGPKARGLRSGGLSEVNGIVTVITIRPLRDLACPITFAVGVRPTPFI